MPHTNIEIKATCNDPEAVRRYLEEEGARFVGIDHQVDTYFRTREGRLKLREGNIEHALIFYRRHDESGPKLSDVTLYHPERDAPLKAMLSEAFGVDVVVDKRRAIYFIDNVKFHVDEVDALGSFVEIEAIDIDGSIGIETLRRQCDAFVKALGIRDADLLSVSYSDMMRDNLD